jgi:hypothetical protein
LSRKGSSARLCRWQLARRTPGRDRWGPLIKVARQSCGPLQRAQPSSLAVHCPAPGRQRLFSRRRSRLLQLLAGLVRGTYLGVSGATLSCSQAGNGLAYEPVAVLTVFVHRNMVNSPKGPKEAKAQ